MIQRAPTQETVRAAPRSAETRRDGAAAWLVCPHCYKHACIPAAPSTTAQAELPDIASLAQFED
eukprot:668276-Pleurochrysis_carterae.AAC.12